MPTFTPADRQLFRAAARAAHDAELAAASSSRSYRNALVVSTVLLGVAAVLFPLLLTRTDMGVVDLGSATSTSPSPPLGAAELYALELWGVLGALVGAIAGIRNLRGSTQPIGLQIAQLALKIPTGALTALVGIVLLQAALTPSAQPVSHGRLAAFAILFGAAQEALTSFVDRTAGQLLDKSKTLGDKTSTAV